MDIEKLRAGVAQLPYLEQIKGENIGNKVGHVLSPDEFQIVLETMRAIKRLMAGGGVEDDISPEAVACLQNKADETMKGRVWKQIDPPPPDTIEELAKRAIETQKTGHPFRSDRLLLWGSVENQPEAGWFDPARGRNYFTRSLIVRCGYFLA